MAEQERRGGDDPRIGRLIKQAEESHRTHIRTRTMVDDILRLNGEQAKMRVALEENTELTRRISISVADNTAIIAQVRDVLASFKVIASVAKWLTVMAILITSALALVKGILGFNDITPR